ncbi:MAG: glycosyltransferase [Bacillota bacterium]|nr:glycosyltransferase [Bacillota bacterium]
MVNKKILNIAFLSTSPPRKCGIATFTKKKYLKLIYIYLSFIYHALNDNGMFKNFMSYQRVFLETEGSEDCFGRCLWALGCTISSPAIPQNIKNTCNFILKKADKNIDDLNSPRAKAYTIVGLSFIKDQEQAVIHIEKQANSLIEQYKIYKDGDWHWFEDSITYGNAFFPWSLFCAYKILGAECYLEIAKESMDFLESIVMKPNYFKPIGCDGWFHKGKTPSEYDEQPLEACEMLYAYMEYYEVVKDKKHLDSALKCFNWYKGENSKQLCLIDKDSGACYDGIRENGLNLSQGSESIISYGMAVMKVPK